MTTSLAAAPGEGGGSGMSSCGDARSSKDMLGACYITKKKHFQRRSKWIFEDDFCVRLRAGASVNKSFLKEDVCPPPLIREKKIKMKP